MSKVRQKRKHSVHLWQLIRPQELICIRCGITRKTGYHWPFDPEELGR